MGTVERVAESVLVAPLEAWDESDVELIGGKAVGLLRLKRLGCRVPRSFCVSAQAYREHLAGGSLAGALDRVLVRLPRCDDEEAGAELAELRRRIIDLPPSESLVAEVRWHTDALGVHAVAVRSSATVEDRAEAAHAGLHETLLNVQGPAACMEATVQCWASLWSRPAWAYRAARGIDHRRAAMAVIVQQFVAAEVSGVVFSADPVTGARDRVVVESARGLGALLVAGHVTPDRFVLSRPELEVIESEIASRSRMLVAAPGGGVEERSVYDATAPRPSIDEPTVRALAGRVVELEENLGAPQDVEWAQRDGELVYLQARPITTMAASRPDEDRQVWSNLNTGEVMPDVVTPFSWSVMEEALLVIRHILRRVGIDAGDHPLGDRVAGRVYFNLNTFMAIARAFPTARWVDVNEVLGGAQAGAVALEIPDDAIPPVRAGLPRLLLHLPAAALMFLMHRPPAGERYRARMADARRRLEQDELDSQSEAELLDRVGGVLATIFRDRCLLAYPATGMLYFMALDRICDRWFRGGEPVTANALLAGRGGLDSAEAGLALWDLAATARSAPEVAKVIRNGASWRETQRSLGSTDEGRSFLRRWSSFMNRHGHHTRGELELANPRWSETPDYVLDLVRSYVGMPESTDLEADYRDRSRRSEQLARTCRASLRNPLRRIVFNHLLRNAAMGSAVRENLKSEAVRLLALLRRILLHLAGRLVERGVLAEPEEIFFVTRDELTGIVDGSSTIDVRRVVRLRRREHERWVAMTPPPIIRGRFDPADCPPEEEIEPALVLHGMAVSPGVATGPARVILHSDGDETVRPGEILVAPFTDPGWTPYFLPAAAIVMDMGGVLSHGSIVAREYGMPAVVNVGPATKLIRTGQRIRVDGNKGEVRILGEGTEARRGSARQDAKELPRTRHEGTKGESD